MNYRIQDKEAGNIIDTFPTREAAERALADYEKSDTSDGTYSVDFYEIVEVEDE